MPILGFPREEGLWYLDTDTSDVGTGAVLSQIWDVEERVIAYVSKSLEGSEQRYCTARKELLAVVRALKHFKCYLYGQKITVRTLRDRVVKFQKMSRPGPRTRDAKAIGATNKERRRIGRRWREGVPFGGHSRDMENATARITLRCADRQPALDEG